MGIRRAPQCRWSALRSKMAMSSRPSCLAVRCGPGLSSIRLAPPDGNAPARYTGEWVSADHDPERWPRLRNRLCQQGAGHSCTVDPRAPPIDVDLVLAERRRADRERAVSPPGASLGSCRDERRSMGRQLPRPCRRPVSPAGRLVGVPRSPRGRSGSPRQPRIRRAAPTRTSK